MFGRTPHGLKTRATIKPVVARLRQVVLRLGAIHMGGNRVCDDERLVTRMQ